MKLRVLSKLCWIVCALAANIAVFPLMASGQDPADCPNLAVCQTQADQVRVLDVAPSVNSPGQFYDEISGVNPSGTYKQTSHSFYPNIYALTPTQPTQAMQFDVSGQADLTKGFTVAMVYYLEPATIAKQGLKIPLASFSHPDGGAVSILGFDGAHFTLENRLGEDASQHYVQTFWNPQMYEPTTQTYAPDGFYEIFFTFRANQTALLDVMRYSGSNSTPWLACGNTTPVRNFCWIESPLDSGWPVRYNLEGNYGGKIILGSANPMRFSAGVFWPTDYYAKTSFQQAGFTYTTNQYLYLARWTVFNQPLSRNLIFGFYNEMMYGSVEAGHTALLTDADLNAAENNNPLDPVLRPNQLLPCDTGKFLDKSGVVAPVQTPCKSYGSVAYPVSPSGVTLTGGSASVEAKWTPAAQPAGNLPVRSYSVSLNVQGNGSNPVRTETLGPNATQFAFYGLVPGVSYSVSVLANSYVPAQAATTSNEAMPVRPEVANCGDGSTGAPCTPAVPSLVGFASSGASYYRETSTSLACNAETFGDPAPGTAKSCSSAPLRQYPAAPEGYVFCAYEGGTCYVPNTGSVVMGAFSQFSPTVPVTTNNSQIPCSAGVFGLGTAAQNYRACFYKANQTAPSAVRDLGISTASGSLTASWVPPASNGGSTVTAYNVQIFNNGSPLLKAITTSRSQTFYGLSPVSPVNTDTTFNVQVTATNEENLISPAASSGNTQVSVFWTQCATENGTCNAPADAVIRYGTSLSNPVAYYKNLSGLVGCNNTVFGDPASGSTKYCWYTTSSSLPQSPSGYATNGYSLCAYDHFNCYFSGSGSILYGNQSGVLGDPSSQHWLQMDVFAGEGKVPCEPNAFGGDPSPGNQKACLFIGNAGIPSEPSSLSVSTSYGQATIHWGAPSSQGSSAISGYAVSITYQGELVYKQTVPATERQQVVNGLTPGKDLVASVSAVNASGEGRNKSSSPFQVYPVYWSYCAIAGFNCPVFGAGTGQDSVARFIGVEGGSSDEYDDKFYLNLPKGSHIECGWYNFGGYQANSTCYITPRIELPAAPDGFAGDSKYTFCAYEGEPCAIPYIPYPNKGQRIWFGSYNGGLGNGHGQWTTVPWRVNFICEPSNFPQQVKGALRACFLFRP